MLSLSLSLSKNELQWQSVSRTSILKMQQAFVPTPSTLSLDQT